MKIVEFGEDGKPQLLKQGGAGQPTKAHEEAAPVTRETSTLAASFPRTRVEIDTARIKIREFGTDATDEQARKPAQKPSGSFGSARVPQSIKIVDFDKASAKTGPRVSQAHDRPRGMKIVETE